MCEKRLLYRVEIRGVDGGWEIVDWVQGRFCKRGLRISRSVASGAAGKQTWKKKRGKILSFFFLQNTGLGQNRVGRRNQLRQCEAGWTAKSGELGRETKGRTRHNGTGLTFWSLNFTFKF